jgi:predicted ester cyclase
MNQQNKAVVWQYWCGSKGLGQTGASSSDHRSILSESLSTEVTWHGFHPLRNLSGLEEVWSKFWEPLLTAIPDLIRRPYIFISGDFEGADWVCGTGDLIGTFIHEWLGIPASGSSVHFRFGEFCKVENGQIVEIRMIVDLTDLIRQAGINLLPPNYGRNIWPPGPMAGDGILRSPQDPAESEKTLALVEAMIFGGLNKYDGRSQDSQGLERFWHPNMVWHGPVGIGSAYGMEEFKKNAQGPIVGAFPDRRGVGHQARIAEGRFAASTGWPSLVGTHQNAYMDWSPTGGKIGWNIMDFWKREGDLLLENWVMIDIIGAALQSGVDLMLKLSTSIKDRDKTKNGN